MSDTTTSKGSIFVRTSFAGDLTLPNGDRYDFQLRPHETAGTLWYEGFAVARDTDVLARDRIAENAFQKDGSRPAHFPPESTARPLQLKINANPKYDVAAEKPGRSHIGTLGTASGYYTLLINDVGGKKGLALAGDILDWKPRAELQAAVTPPADDQAARPSRRARAPKPAGKGNGSDA